MAENNEGTQPEVKPHSTPTRRWENSGNWRTKAPLSTETTEIPDREEREPATRQLNPKNNHISDHWRSNNSSRISSDRDQKTNPHPASAGQQRPYRHGSSNNAAFPEGRRLYVGNMPYMAKREDVEELFNTGDDGSDNKGFYQIEQINISTDPFTGRNPSYCFVDLTSKEQADHAMQHLDGKMMLGRPVKIKPGVPRSGGHPSLGRRDPSAPNKEEQQPQKFTFERWERDDASNHWYGYAPVGKRLFVGGLPRMPNQPTADYEIRKVFYGFNIEAISKIISPDPKKQPESHNRYYLFVDLESSEEADRAIKTLGDVSAVWGHRLQIKKVRGNSRKPSERDQWRAKNDGNEGGDSPSSDAIQKRVNQLESVSP